jgi:hypothetical protein
MIRSFILLFIAALLLPCVVCETVYLPATRDVYLSSSANPEVINSNTLKFMTVQSNSMWGSSIVYAPHIQFDISKVDMAGGRRAYVLLIPEDKLSDDINSIQISTEGTRWNERSSAFDFINVGLSGPSNPAFGGLDYFSEGKIVDSDSGEIIQFDVTDIIMELRDKGEDRVSFSVYIDCSGECQARFYSRETGEKGPIMVILDYKDIKNTIA